jgi:hypothetical protein
MDKDDIIVFEARAKALKQGNSPFNVRIPAKILKVKPFREKLKDLLLGKVVVAHVKGTLGGKIILSFEKPDEEAE